MPVARSGLYAKLVGAMSGEAIWLYASRFSAVLLQSVSLLLIAGLIGVEEFGRFAFLFSASQVMAVILSIGSPQLLQRELPSRDALYDGIGNLRIVSQSLLKTFAFAAAIAVFLVTIGSVDFNLFGAIFLHEAMLITFAGLLLGILHIAVAVVRVARSATYSMMLRDLVPYFLFLLGFLGLFYIGLPSARDVLLIYCAALGISFLASMLASIDYLSKRKGGIVEGKISNKQHLTFWGSSIIGTALSQIDTLVARFFLSDAGLGIYSILRRVSNLISIPQVIADWSINVKVATDFALGNYGALQQHANRGLLLAVPVSAVILALLLLSSPVWLAYFDVSVTGGVVLIFMLLLGAQFFNVMSGANMLFASQCREELYVVKARMISLAVGIVVMTGGASHFGGVGIAIGVLLAVILVNTLVVRHVHSKTGTWTSLRLVAAISGARKK